VYETIDHTKTAADIQVGWEVSDDKSYGKLIVGWVERREGITYFAGTQSRDGKPFYRAWADDERIVTRTPGQAPPVTINVNEWSRAKEVRSYARWRGLTVTDAIRQLVNHGLSHL